jgi:hypothetical protein
MTGLYHARVGAGFITPERVIASIGIITHDSLRRDQSGPYSPDTV